MKNSFGKLLTQLDVNENARKWDMYIFMFEVDKMTIIYIYHNYFKSTQINAKYLK